LFCCLHQTSILELLPNVVVKIPYTILPSKSLKQIYKPLINIVLNYKKTHKVTLPVKALIDSGADVCFCSDMIAAWLGIRLDKIKNTYYLVFLIISKLALMRKIVLLKLNNSETICIYRGVFFDY
jgi:hypothetical protein